MYSMASWSPSQSEPLTVSYMCQRQSSGPMLPSEAEMPPCAATVWLRVGNTLVMQAVLQALVGHAEGGAQAGAAGADHDHVVLVVDDRVGAAADIDRARRCAVALAVARLGHAQPPNPIRRMATMAASPKNTARNLDEHDHRELQPSPCDVVLRSPPACRAGRDAGRCRWSGSAAP